MSRLSLEELIEKQRRQIESQRRFVKVWAVVMATLVVMGLLVVVKAASAESAFSAVAPLRAMNDVTRTVMLKQHPGETTSWDISCGRGGAAPREYGACVTTYRVGPPGTPRVWVHPSMYQESPGGCSFQLRIFRDGVFNARTTTKRGTCLRIRAVRQEG